VDAALWVVAGVVLLLVELLSLTVAAGMVGVGALVAALAAVLGAPVAVQAGVFVATSTGLLVLARAPVQRALTRGDASASADPRALAGTPAVVVERVSAGTGQVRLNGELWRARPWAGCEPVDVGEHVTVAAVEGATVLVYPTPSLTA
jgi:membrane protein implicated in regulation of membrane protease activity